MLEAIDLCDTFNPNLKKLDSQMSEMIFAQITLKDMKLFQNTRDETTVSRASLNAVWIPHVQGASVLHLLDSIANGR